MFRPTSTWPTLTGDGGAVLNVHGREDGEVVHHALNLTREEALRQAAQFLRVAIEMER